MAKKAYLLEEEMFRSLQQQMQEQARRRRSQPRFRARYPVAAGGAGGGSGTELVEGFLDELLPASTADGAVETEAVVSVWSGNGGDWADTGDNITVTNRNDNLELAAGTYVVVAQFGTEYRVLIPTCSGQNEIQHINVFGMPTGGTFTLTLDGEATGNIAWDANAATVESALEALSNVGSGNVSVSGGPLPNATMVVEFIDDLAFTDVEEMRANWSSLTGGSGVGILIKTEQQGRPD